MARPSPSTSLPLPLALTPADFDAPDAAGEAYLFERLLGWAAAMRIRLRAVRVPLEVSAPPAADGARRLFFSRPPRTPPQVRTPSGRAAKPRSESSTPDLALASGAKAPIHRTRPAGASLSLTLTREGIEVALEVPAKAKAERAALHELLHDQHVADILVEEIRVLPEPFVLGTAADDVARTPVQKVTADVLLSALDESTAAGDALWIGWRVPRATALGHAGTLGGELEVAVLALGDFFRRVAWPMPAPTPSAPATNRKPKPVGANAKAKETAADERPSSSPPPRTLLRSASTSRGLVTRSKMRLRSSTTGARRAGRRAEAEKAETEPAAIERGSSVSVLAGPFEGRTGVVQELDGKGNARVLFGLLATRVPLADLGRSEKNAAGERPALPSSHRKARP